MSIRSRLNRLELRPRFPLPTPKSDEAMTRRFQSKLCLPVSESATDAERAECLALMKTAQDRLRANREDTGGLDAVRDYALGLHEKYGTDPTWGQGPGNS